MPTEERKVAVVTGAESGIGRASCDLMLSRGYTVVGADIKQSEKRRSDGERYIYVETDVTDKDQVDVLFQRTFDLYGRIDVLLNCAGITGLEMVPHISREAWDRMMEINLTSVFFCCQKALEIMVSQRSGKIVNISSNAGKGGGKAVGVHYSASKAGVIGLTQSLALYAAEFGVNVNCVAPGPTKTPMTGEWSDEINAVLREKIPLHRFAEPAEIAEAILFLASEKADFITGETLNVNGGLLMD
jgi:NAD(P)-dependent dehydrogenase (short-subunit alcohol dehydrogenase family)